MFRGVLFFLVILAVPISASGDYQSGRDAYDSEDYALASHSWLAAAESGDPQSQFALAQLYEQGMGVPQSYLRAHLFYNLAGSKGLAEAREARDALAAKMSVAQVAEAQRLALNWTPVGTPPMAMTEDGKAPDGDTVSLRWSGVSEASLAVLGDELSTLKSLLKAGTDPNVPLPNGDTLLLQAVRNSSLPIVDSLIQAGANVNTIGPHGWTPLKAAIYDGRTDVAKRLLSSGADPGQTTPDGLNALALAQRLGYAELVSLLSR
jgi:hypothetical protein